MQQTTVNALKAIGESPISDYNVDFDTTILEIYATKSIVAINEIISFNIVTSIELIEVEWDFGDGRVNNQIAKVIKKIIS